jgi:hypothetical protein
VVVVFGVVTGGVGDRRVAVVADSSCRDCVPKITVVSSNVRENDRQWLDWPLPPSFKYLDATCSSKML